MNIDIASLRGLDAFVAARDEAAARAQEIEAESGGGLLSAEQRKEMEELTSPDELKPGMIVQLDAAIDELRIRQARIESITRAAVVDGRSAEGPSASYSIPNLIKKPDNIYDLAAYRKSVNSIEELPGAYRDGAMRALEVAKFPGKDSGRDQIAALVEQHIDDRDEGRNGWVARHVIGTSEPLYIEAYADAMKGHPQSGRRLAVLQTYTDADGGFAVPVVIDPTFVNTSDGSVNPIRRIARNETTTGKNWQAITTAGVVASYVGERSSTGAADGAPTDVNNPTVTPVRADVSVDISLEYLQDYGSASLLGQLGSLIGIAKDDLEANKFFQGTGSGQPEGVVWFIDDDGSSLVPTITAHVFALEDVDKIVAALPPRFRSRAQFTANLFILQVVRNFGTAGQPGFSIYDPIAKTLRGYPASEASAMDDTLADNAEVLLFGDFQQFVVVDRLGLTTRLLDARDTNGRPTGNSQIYAAWRNSTKVLFPNAFRLLQIKAS